MRVETRLYINTDRANVQIAFEIPESEWRAISQTKQWNKICKMIRKAEKRKGVQRT
jgi:hypothetical protein